MTEAHVDSFEKSCAALPRSIHHKARKTVRCARDQTSEQQVGRQRHATQVTSFVMSGV
jgi:hypothetical protein